MKIISKPFISVLCLAIAMLSTTFISAQSKSNEKDFTIIVQQTKTGIKMKCIKGCAWKDLSFSTNGKRAQSVDQFGVFNAESKRQTANPKFLDFEFSILREKNKYTINGLKGTSWQQLSFEPNNGAQFFNSTGLVKVQ